MLYLSQKWSDCHETKSKHIDWTLGLKCDQRVWPWPWPWPWIFKVKYRICYISAKNGPIATKRKANIWIELWGSNVTSGFDLGHDLDLEFSRSNIEFAISQPKMVRLPRNEKQSYRLNSRPQMWPMVWIYQIVTGVTSVVGVPSTHLVNFEYQGQISMSYYLYLWVDSLWFWTMFNGNPPIAHCYPLLQGGGILVDHWSTISSLLIMWCILNNHLQWYEFIVVYNECLYVSVIWIAFVKIEDAWVFVRFLIFDTQWCQWPHRVFCSHYLCILCPMPHDVSNIT